MHRFRLYLSHLHIKFERNVIFILLFIFFIAGFVTSEYLASQELQALITVNKDCQSLLTKTMSTPSSFTQQDIDLYTDKANTLKNVTASYVSFTSKVNSLSKTKKEVVISLTGNAGMKMDAADLVISFPNTVTVTSVLLGNSFPTYLRKVVTKNQVIVSGATSLSDGVVTFGQSNTPFVTLQIEKVGPSTQEEELTIDAANTKVFFQGVSILDKAKSITKIIL